MINQLIIAAKSITNYNKCKAYATLSSFYAHEYNKSKVCPSVIRNVMTFKTPCY